MKRLQDYVSEPALSKLQQRAHLWLVTGGAGFIGSHLVERLLLLGQRVICVDNFSTGTANNLREVERTVGKENWKRLAVREADIRDRLVCEQFSQDVDFVLHQAAVASVPRSIDDPIHANDVNLCGTLNLLAASSNSNVKRFIYASSCSVYSGSTSAEDTESPLEQSLSPYAISKAASECYARSFSKFHGLCTIGLRYFNVYGPRQRSGIDAAVIPYWIESVLDDKPIYINGDGEITRDFTFVADVVDANLAAAFAEPVHQLAGEVFNVGFGKTVSLNQLAECVHQVLSDRLGSKSFRPPVHRGGRPGDLAGTQADLTKSSQRLGYQPIVPLEDGLSNTVAWFLNNLERELEAWHAIPSIQEK